MNAHDPIELSAALRSLSDAVWQHIPPAAGWFPAACLAAVGLAGLILLLRGAWLAPAVAGLGFAALGAAGGAFLSKAAALPLWPSVVCSGLVGSLCGLLLFRLWLALFLAAALTFAGGSVYYVRVLTPYVAGYTSEGWNPQTNLNSLNPATAECSRTPACAGEELAKLFRYLSQSVPGFTGTAGGIAGVSGVLGLLLSLLFPWAARSLWAALVGTGLLALSLLLSLQELWPAGLSLLERAGAWNWALLGALALGSFVCNFYCGVAPQAGRPPVAPAGARTR
jgi:hypothetical protein